MIVIPRRYQNRQVIQRLLLRCYSDAVGHIQRHRLPDVSLLSKLTVTQVFTDFFIS